MDTQKLFIELKEEIQALGYSTIDEGPSTLSIELPLSCSVRFSQGAQTFKWEARFGFMSRVTATWWHFVLVSIFLFIVFFFSPEELQTKEIQILVTPLVILSGIWEVYRYILTESLITRIQLITFQLYNKSK